jgi:hypothetical protein
MEDWTRRHFSTFGADAVARTGNLLLFYRGLHVCIRNFIVREILFSLEYWEIEIFRTRIKPDRGSSTEGMTRRGTCDVCCNAATCAKAADVRIASL